MLKGHVFENQLFGNPIFAVFVNTFLAGENGVINGFGNGMSVTTSGSNLTVQSGVVCIQGRFLQEDSSTTISAGSTPAYARLVVEIDLDKTNTENDFQQGYYKIITNSSAYPTLTQTDIVNNVSGVYQFSLGRFQITANGVTDYADERTFLDYQSIYDMIRSMILDIENESIYTIKGEKLWENPNPSSSFAGQDIEFDEINNYQFYKFEYKPTKDSNYTLLQDVRMKGGDTLTQFQIVGVTPFTPGYDTKGYLSMQVRTGVGNSRGVAIGDCLHYTSNSGTKEDPANNYMIPVAIYGYNL